jgi:gliding motility-associated-like protein
MRNILILGSLFFFCLTAKAQTESGLVAHYLFDGNLLDARGNAVNEGIPMDEPAYDCGLINQSLLFNGGSNEIRFDGQVNNEFNSTEDFTVSLYFKANVANGEMYLLSKRRFNCETENSFYIKYQPSSNAVNVYLEESSGRIINILAQLSQSACWHHIVVVRNAGRVRLYGDGRFLAERNTLGRIDLMSEGNLILGSSDCFRGSEVPFNGVIDEMRVYNRALNENEIRDLYFQPEQIATRDTIVFVGNPIPMSLTANCASSFSWTPTVGVSAVSSPNPVITPAFEGDYTYAVQMRDAASGCVASDSIQITVVDPSSLDCTEAYLPNTFTPNDDGINDEFGLSNPFAIPEMISLEIFDRWGSRVYATTDPFQRWDGSYKGKRLNPGVVKYRVRYICRGEELERFGTVMVMR